jgi:uncharacterized protein (TIGR03437 family)
MKSFLFAILWLALPGVAPVAGATHVVLRYLDIGEQGSLQALAADAAGNIFAVATVAHPLDGSVIRVIKTDSNARPLASFELPVSAGGVLVSGAAVDPQGNLVFVGGASSGFPLVSPLFPPVSANDSAAFVVKLDSELHGILFSTTLPGPSRANAVALDAAGNIHVAGGTTASNFPLTAGAYHTKNPGAFITAISSAGDRVLYSTYFDGETTFCHRFDTGPGSDSFPCPGYGTTSATTIALDPFGTIVIGGTTKALDLPVTPGSLGTTCVCGLDSATGFVAKFSPGAAHLVWATYVNPEVQQPFPGIAIDALALDSAGDVVFGGLGGRGTGLPTTPGVVQPVLPPEGTEPAFIAKLSSAGTALIWSSYFGADGPSTGPGVFDAAAVTGVAVDSQGRIVLTGHSDRNLLPAPPGTPLFGDGYAARLSADGRSLDTLYVGPEDAVGLGPLLNAGGQFTIGGPSGALWIETVASGPSLLATANAASGPVSSPAAPWELLSLYGLDIGPQAALGGQVQYGFFSTGLRGYQVLFDGIAAPLLYAGPTQISTIVPSRVLGRETTHLQIRTPLATIDGPTLLLRPAVPYIFRNDQTRLSAALNQDGSPNSPSNPARPGSVVTVFATGCGQRPWLDGYIVPVDGVVSTALPVSVLGPSSNSLEVLSAGDAPGLVAGVTQISFRLPQVLPPGNTYGFQLQVGDVLGGGGSVAVAP